jgi:hypothetical protein
MPLVGRSGAGPLGASGKSLMSPSGHASGLHHRQRPTPRGDARRWRQVRATARLRYRSRPCVDRTLESIPCTRPSPHSPAQLRSRWSPHAIKPPRRPPECLPHRPPPRGPRRNARHTQLRRRPCPFRPQIPSSDRRRRQRRETRRGTIRPEHSRRNRSRRGCPRRGRPTITPARRWNLASGKAAPVSPRDSDRRGRKREKDAVRGSPVLIAK